MTKKTSYRQAKGCGESPSCTCLLSESPAYPSDNVKKSFIPVVVILLLFSLHTGVFAAEGSGADPIPAVLNGSELDAAAYDNNGVPYLPLREIGESLGYEIRWSGENNAVYALKGGENIMIDLKNNQITANDHAYYMGGDYLGIPADGCMMINGRTYMRADLFTELGLYAQWDKGNKIILQSIKKNAITTKTVKQNSENDIIKITLQYPRIDGLGDKAVQDSINSIFEKEALQARDEGLRNAEEMKDLKSSGGISSPHKCETYFDYSVKYDQNGMLSIAFLNYQYTGGAHGLTLQTSYTLDLKTGKEYELKDMMKGEAGYVSFISGIVRNEIDEKTRAGELAEIAAFNTIKDDQDFYLSDSGLVVYFQQYEYFPYAAGIQAFPIEFSTLKDMLKSDLSFLYDGSNSIKLH